MRTKKTYEKEYRKKLSAIKGRKAGGIFSIAAVILISFIILYINNGGFNFENDFSVSLLRPGDNPIASAKDEICTVHVIDIGQGDSNTHLRRQRSFCTYRYRTGFGRRKSAGIS